MDFQIYTPYVNRKDLLLSAIARLGRFADKVVVLDNSLSQDLQINGFPGEIVKPVVPLFCAQSYNLILKIAQRRQQDVFFIMHSDAEASEDVVEQALAKAQDLNDEGVRWGVLFTNYDVLCLHNTAVLRDFQWDHYLPLYFTDVDFYRRLRLADIAIIETHLPVGHANGGSSSMKADRALREFVLSNYPAWRRYYMTKWGGDHRQETFLTPFGDAE